LKLVFKIALGIILAVILLTAGCSALLASDPEVRKATAALDDATAAPEQSEPARPGETAGQDNARRSAENYLDTMPFSRQGLIEQLSSQAGAGFTHAQAVYGVNAAGL
jgi:Host cell surface-exposed lipoprotein